MRIARVWKVLLWLLVTILLVMDGLFVYDLLTNHMSNEHTPLSSEHLVTSRLPSSVDQLPPATARSFLQVKMVSGKEKASVVVGDVEALTATDNRGLYVAVVNQATGAVMAQRRFDTYMPGDSDLLDTFIDSIMDGRYLFFVIKDEGTFHLGKPARDTLRLLGSNLAGTLHWRDAWVFGTQKQGNSLGEDVGKSPSLSDWGVDTTLTVRFPLEHSEVSCDWPESDENVVRREFCSRYEGYGKLCDCSHPLPISIKSEPLLDNHIRHIPLAIIASNRPQYLFRSLRSILSSAGANASMVTVFIDGFFHEPEAVAKLYGVRSVQHEPKSQRNGRITQHYGFSLKKIFQLYPEAPYAIIVEEDLEVSPDFFGYFSQTLGLMEQDDSLYCVSAWNDLGYQHSCEDSQLTYRVETMPGLGWLLGRRLFQEELEKAWPSPDKLWDWDMWMRTDGIRKGRECIIPDVSRTYHFGNTGTNVNPYFQESYFKKHRLNQQPTVKMRDVHRMTRDRYETVIHELIGNASKHLMGDPCKASFVPDTKGKIYTMYISKETQTDYDTWMGVATCFKLWDLDARGFHKSLWRFWINNNQIVVIGCPHSPYCKYKPSDLQTIKIPKKKNK